MAITVDIEGGHPSTDGDGFETSDIGVRTATLIVLTVTDNDGSSDVTDNQGPNVYIPGTLRNTGSVYVRQFYCLNPTITTSLTFTVSCNPGAAPWLSFQLFINDNGVLSFDGENGAVHAASGYTNPFHTGTVTPAHAVAVFVSGAATDSTYILGMQEHSDWVSNNSNAADPGIVTGGGTAHKIVSAVAADEAEWYGNVAAFPAIATSIMVFSEWTAPSSTLQWGLELELNGPGEGWTDVTRDLGPAPIECEYGIEGSDPTDRVASTGSLSFSLNNSESNSAQTIGYYSPFHPAKRAGFDFNIGCRFWLWFGTDKIYKHVGKLSDILPTPGINKDLTVTCKSLDWMDDAARNDVPDLAAQTEQRGDQVLTTILDAMASQPVARDIDTWVDTFKFALDGGSGQKLKVLQQQNNLAMSEQGWISIIGDALTGGVLRAEKRGARATFVDPVVFNDDVTESVMAELIMSGSRDDVYSAVRVIVHPPKVDDDPTSVLFRLEQTTTVVQPGETISTIFGPYRNPSNGEACGGMDMEAPDAGTDFEMNSAEDGSGTDLTGDFTVTASYTGEGVRYTAITNTGGTPGYIRKLEARGRGIFRTDAEVQKTVVGSYGDRVLTLDLPLQTSVNVATLIATYLADLLGTPAARVKGVGFCASASDDFLTAAIVREIGARVEISETVTGLNASRFMIQKIRLELSTGRLDVVWYLAPWGLDASWTGPGGAAAIEATGGDITDSGGFRYHTFLVGGDEEFEITANDDAVPVEVLLVPAGGAGGGLRGGGGGGGKVKTFSNAGAVGVYPIVVGEGADASNGGDSSAFGVTGKGGGKGGTSSAGVAGGNGGGGSGPGNAGGASTDGGHTGGAGAIEDGGGSDDGGGGGAGDTGDGNAADYFLGNGGPGRTVWGTAYAGGGGGNQDTGSGNGRDGGGDGGAGGNPSTAGTDGLGGGGGGGEDKRGGHGRVVVRYPLAV